MEHYKKELLEQWDHQYVWHPFTQMQEYIKMKPMVIERGEGSYLIDIEGKRYLDGVSSLWVTVHGHNKKELNDAIKEQVDRISHSTLLGLANVPSILLAKKLVELTPPGLNRVFYSDSGSTAVEIALKMAFQYWKQKEGGAYQGKTRYISLGEAYHGDTIGSVSVGWNFSTMYSAPSCLDASMFPRRTATVAPWGFPVHPAAWPARTKWKM